MCNRMRDERIIFTDLDQLRVRLSLPGLEKVGRFIIYKKRAIYSNHFDGNFISNICMFYFFAI